MMKILLTVPVTSFVNDPPNIPDLGLGYIAASLKNKGHEVHVRDWNMDPSQEKFKVWLKENRPEVIGIKVFTKDVAAAQKTITIIRETLWGTLIVIGGPHPSASEPADLMNDFVDCDFAIRGEAEESLPSLLSEIKNSGFKDAKSAEERYKNVPGLVWLKGGNVFSNPISLCHNLDDIDFPCWEMINPKDYSVDMLGSTLKEGYTSTIITTKGCPGKCSFCCAYKISGRKIRYRSPSNVLKEISLLYNKYNVKKFMFMDNCFTSHKENLIKICEGILKEKMIIEWDFVSYEKLDNLTDTTLTVMYRSGCRMIHMGIESGSEKTRKVMNKSCSLKEITEKIKVIKDNGIHVGAWFMIGFPEETKKEIRETTNYAFSLDADLLTFTICFPLPGTQIYDYIKGRYKFSTINWASFNIKNSPYPVSQLSSKELNRMLKFIRLRLRLWNVCKIAMRKIIKALGIIYG
jgi:radical SAM superfamily enzyme YgiQ (UPF0313 family)